MKILLVIIVIIIIYFIYKSEHLPITETFNAFIYFNNKQVAKGPTGIIVYDPKSIIQTPIFKIKKIMNKNNNILESILIDNTYKFDANFILSNIANLIDIRPI